MTERIIRAAIKVGDLVVHAPPPNRHHNLMSRAIVEGGVKRITQEMQGFLTSEGRFVDRYEAMVIARAQGQLIPRAAGFMEGEVSSSDTLFSEDVW